jgi:trimethylamine:corrinoid methyltransferase-like protein
MVRNYKKKTDRKITSPTKLAQAIKLVSGGWAIRAAASHVNINRSALVNAIKKSTSTGNNIKLSYASRNIFTDEQEKSIADYCIQVCKMGYGLTIEKVRELAWEVSKQNKIPVPRNWDTEMLAGIEWFQGLYLFFFRMV